MFNSDLDLINQEDIKIDKKYIEKSIKESVSTPISIEAIKSKIAGLRRDDDNLIEKIIIILIQSKIMSIIFSIESTNNCSENKIDKLLKRYKISNSRVTLPYSKNGYGPDKLYFCKSIENNKIVLEFGFEETKFYATGTDQDFHYRVRINYRILEFFEIAMASNMGNIKKVANNTLLNYRAKKERESASTPKSDYEYDKDVDHSWKWDTLSYIEMFGELPD